MALLFFIQSAFWFRRSDPTRFLLFSDINLLLELLISLKNYESALEIMHRHCSAQFTSQVTKEQLAKLNPGKYSNVPNSGHLNKHQHFTCHL